MLSPRLAESAEGARVVGMPELVGSELMQVGVSRTGESLDGGLCGKVVAVRPKSDPAEAFPSIGRDVIVAPADAGKLGPT